MNIPPEWKVLLDRKKDLSDSLRQVEREMEGIASALLLESFKQGKWRVSENPYCPDLIPLDHEAEDALETILSQALKLGYHDRFTVTGIGQVTLHGQVNDGTLSLSIVVGLKPDPAVIQDDIKRLHLDFDLTNFIRSTSEASLTYAQRDLEKARARVQAIQDTLATLT